MSAKSVSLNKHGNAIIILLTHMAILLCSSIFLDSFTCPFVLFSTPYIPAFSLTLSPFSFSLSLPLDAPLFFLSVSSGRPYIVLHFRTDTIFSNSPFVSSHPRSPSPHFSLLMLTLSLFLTSPSPIFSNLLQSFQLSGPTYSDLFACLHADIMVSIFRLEISQARVQGAAKRAAKLARSLQLQQQPGKKTLKSTMKSTLKSTAKPSGTAKRALGDGQAEGESEKPTLTLTERTAEAK